MIWEVDILEAFVIFSTFFFMLKIFLYKRIIKYDFRREREEKEEMEGKGGREGRREERK